MRGGARCERAFIGVSFEVFLVTTTTTYNRLARRPAANQAVQQSVERVQLASDVQAVVWRERRDVEVVLTVCVGLLTDKNAAYDSSSNRTGADVHAKRDIHMLTTNCKCLQRGAPGCRASDGNGE